jgi:hypothetical protein
MRAGPTRRGAADLILLTKIAYRRRGDTESVVRRVPERYTLVS